MPKKPFSVKNVEIFAASRRPRPGTSYVAACDKNGRESLASYA
jgi:hypothetical protein